MKKFRSFRMYVLASLVIHILVMGGLFLAEALKKPEPIRQAVDIDFVTPEELQQLATTPKQTGPKKPIQTPANQIVEQSETSANEQEVDTRFLSAKNQKVDKQTIAKDRGEFKNVKKPTASKSGPKGNGKEKSEPATREEKLAKDLFKSFDASEALERQKLAEKEGLGKGNGSGATPDGTGDASASNDYIKDVDQGLETMLNTREFKYYSYYSRIRRQLAQHWEGKVREKLTKMFKEGRAPAAANQDRITKLMIVLNDRGTLVRVQVLSDSGVRDLDDAAIEAFRAAAPFPNPPKGIVEGDGTVKIRWDFVLET